MVVVVPSRREFLKQKHQRLELAREQLDVALEMFLSQRSMVSALTLAGAAEEILGKEVSERGGQNSLEQHFDAVGEALKLLDRTQSSVEDLKKRFQKKKNLARNAAKHSGVDLSADIEDEALWMLVRACHNYRLLQLDVTPRMEDFDDWFDRNVVGAEEGP